MADIGSLIAMGLAGFGAGCAYAARGHAEALRQASAAGALVIGCRAFRLNPIAAEVPAPEPRVIERFVYPSETE
jgi:hypothetical protein